MKKALRKDIFRELKKSRNRFLSILVIVALGAGFFSGIKATGPDMKLIGDTYFDNQRLSDLAVMSTYGLNQEDIQAIAAVPGVKGLMPTHSSDMLVATEGQNAVVKVMGLTGTSDDEKDSENALNRPVLSQGRLPQKSGECVVNAEGKLGKNMKLGEQISFVPDGDTLVLDTLNQTTYTVVGKVISPQYISWEMGSTTIGDGTIKDFCMVPDSDFVLEVYTEAYISFETAADMSCFEQDYRDLVDQKSQLVKTVGETRSALRYDEIFSLAQQELDEAQTLLNQKTSEAERTFSQTRQTLSASKKKLDQGFDQLSQAPDKRKSIVAEFDTKQANSSAQLDETIKKRDDLQAYIGATYPDGVGVDPQLTQNLAELNQGVSQLQQGLATLSSTKKDSLAQFDEQVATSQTALKNGKQEYDSGMAAYQAAYGDFLREIQQSQGKIDDSRLELQTIKKPVWYVNTRDLNPGYSGFGDNADRIDAIALVFPVFFFLVAALVCLNTMTRMVEEDRVQIGTLKALGYSGWQIACKYLIYAGSAALIGSLVGMVAGMKVLPYIIYNSYKIMYNTPAGVYPLWGSYLVYITLFCVLCVCGAVIIACRKELLEQPSQLMRPKAPKTGKRVFLERINFVWKRLSFTSKVTIRNLFRYKKRIFMTVLGIAGCTALMLTGFGLKNSISDIIDLQFDQLFTYDALTIFDEERLTGEFDQLSDHMMAQPGVKDSLFARQRTVQMGSGQTSADVYLVVPQDPSKLGDFINLRQRKSGEKIDLPDEELVLSEKTASNFGVQVGDMVYVVGDDNVRYQVPISAICENYVYHYAYMSPGAYQQIFHKEAVMNTAFGHVDHEYLSSYSEAMLKEDSVLTVSLVTSSMVSMNDIMGTLNYVVVVLIVCAGALAFVVLYNLTNININERIREIATIKVLGFTDGEVSAYVYRENIALTVFGVLAGLVGGVFLHRFVIVTAEIDNTMFGRVIHWQSFVLAGVITLVFAMLVNLAMHIRLKKVDLAQSMKSVE